MCSLLFVVETAAVKNSLKFVVIMESLGKLKDADEIFKKIIFTHDMTTEDREEYKRLVSEAKAKEGDDLSGEYLYRVKGAPDSFRVWKIRKRY